jgi:GMP synthase-like glutamine amidotransferase
MFQRFLASGLEDAALLQVSSFETERGELPPLDDSFDGYVLSGSRHGAYEQLPWIADLLAWTRDAVASRRRLLGVCFGHQVIAAALGGSVTPNPAGFEVGGLDLPLTPDARRYFAALLGADAAGAAAAAALPPALRMLYVHGCAPACCCVAPLRCATRCVRAPLTQPGHPWHPWPATPW